MQPSPIADTRRPADPSCRVITGRPPPYRVPAKPTPIASDARTAQPLCISQYAAPFPVTVAMFVDAARPHPGWTRRGSVLTGLAEEIGSGVDEPALGPALEPCFSGQASYPAA